MKNKNKFSIRQPGIIGEEQFRKYAVLVPLIYTPDGIFLLFEKRSNKLRHQPGEICFPGGKVETDESWEECAVRETMEELHIQKEQIEVIGPGDIFISPFNLMVYPFLGEIKEYDNTFSTDEVDEIFKVPLDFFRNQQPERFESQLIHKLSVDFPYEWIPEGENYPWAQGTYDVNFYRYDNLIIWGMTAHIVKSMVKLIDQYNLY